jgi:hypothetical protein
MSMKIGEGVMIDYICSYDTLCGTIMREQKEEDQKKIKKVGVIAAIGEKNIQATIN